MSLTSNTTSLQDILAAVNALPDAGSGGGASVETCTVTFGFRSLMSEDGTEICHYLDGSMQPQSVDWSTLPTITTIKGSIITLYGWSSNSGMTNATLLQHYLGTAVVKVTGDATLTFM